jgi:hypothetical protein
MSKPKTRGIASNRHRAPVADPQRSTNDALKVVDPALEASPLLLHPAAEQALVAVGRVADELAKLNASMDKLIAAKGDAVRPAVEALAEQLIGFLDATAGDPDLEEENEHGDGGADDEPSLGASDGLDQERAWAFGQNPTQDDREHQDEDGDELDRLEVDEVELRGEADGDSGGCVDDEPSLGSLDGRFSQLRWGGTDRDVLWPGGDFEYDEAEHEVGIEDMPHDADATA